MLYIMRHGKTDWNAQGKLQGRTDIPLNDEGRKMAEAAYHECLDIHFDMCYTSPLIRARETADIVLNGRNIPIIVDERLVEMSYGGYEGVADIYNMPDSPINVLFDEPERYESTEGSESFEELFSRTASFISEVLMPEISKGRDILIVGHGALNSAIICQIKNLSISQFWSSGLEQCKAMRLI